MEISRKTILDDEEYLRQVSREVDLNEDYKEEIKALEKFCSENEVFALAAIQIGIPQRMVYLKNTTLDVPLNDTSYNESKVLINPEVIERVGNTTFWEACVSCLDYMGKVRRPYKMTIRYFDENGKEQKETFEGFEATVLSHELDHLDGVLHMDVAEEVIDMAPEDRKAYRETHPYEILDKDGEYKPPKNKQLVK